MQESKEIFKWTGLRGLQYPLSLGLSEIMILINVISQNDTSKP